MSIYARLALVLVIAVCGAGLWWERHQALAKADAAGYARRAFEDEAAADLQRETNRGHARSAEQVYTDRAQPRETFIAQTAKEVAHDAQPLAACPVPEPVRVRLNAAAKCASEDRPAACSAGEPMRAASAPS